MKVPVTRQALVAAAVVALAWLGVLLRDHRIVDGVSPRLIGDSTLSRAEFERDADRLGDARLLNPDPTWRLNRGLALIDRGPRRAARDLERVVADEPDNLAAWQVLYVATERFDRRRSAQALERIERLDPLGDLQARARP
jgi:hypothetical protein